MPATIELSGRLFALLLPSYYQPIIFPLFKPFFIRESDSYDASFAVDFTGDEISLDGTVAHGDVFYREERDDTFSLLDPRFSFCVSLHKRSAVLKVKPDSDLSGAVVYSTLKWFVAFMVIYDGGLPMHSSMIAIDGAGMLFCGPSESGKSTIYTLLAEGVAGAARGSDEINCIFFEESALSIYPTPYFSSARIGNITGSLPLKNIFFLEQAPDHRLENVPNKQVFHHLLRNVYHVAGNKLLAECMLDTIGKIAAIGNFNVLYFKNDSSIAHFLRQQTGSYHEITAK